MTTEVTIGPCRLIHGNAIDVLPTLSGIDLICTDPPYGETSLEWDARVHWQALAKSILKDSGSMWCFGSLRHFMESAADFQGWSLAQDILWEKHNGSNAFADRFRRVHEHAVQFYKSESPWSSIVKNPLFTNDATARAVRRKKRPPQWGDIGESSYESHDGGPRMMRSVMFCKSCHGFAVHPTQKPVETVLPLLKYSSNPDDLVCDPFFGSGTTAVACIETGRRFVGCELTLESFHNAVARCQNAVAIPKMRQRELL